MVKIEGGLLLVLLGSELSSERRKLRSGEDLEEVGNDMDIGGEF